MFRNLSLLCVLLLTSSQSGAQEKSPADQFQSVYREWNAVEKQLTDLQNDYQAGIYLALLSEITEGILGEREVADPQFRLLLLAARAIRTNGPSPAILAYFSLWTVRLGGWLGSLDHCAQCGRSFEQEPGYVSPGSSELFCEKCRAAENRSSFGSGKRLEPISQVALSIGRVALSGTLERLLRSNPSLSGSHEISSYALNILEQHMERKLTSRQMLEAPKSGESNLKN